MQKQKATLTEILFECKADCALGLSLTVLHLKGEVKVFI